MCVCVYLLVGQKRDIVNEGQVSQLPSVCSEGNRAHMQSSLCAYIFELVFKYEAVELRFNLVVREDLGPLSLARGFLRSTPDASRLYFA